MSVGIALFLFITFMTFIISKRSHLRKSVILDSKIYLTGYGKFKGNQLFLVQYYSISYNGSSECNAISIIHVYFMLKLNSMYVFPKAQFQYFTGGAHMTT